MKGNEVPDIPRWSTGSRSLDAELGGGIPKGKIVGIIGEYSAAKTALALKITAEFQKVSDRPVLWVDAEGAWDPRWSKILGIDVPKIDLLRPQYAEQAYDIILAAYDKGFGLVVVDSLEALTTKEELDKNMDEVTVAVKARLNSKLFRKIDKAQIDTEDPCTFIYINQLRYRVGTYGSPIGETGGEALKFYPSIKIHLKAGGYTDGKKVYDYASAIEEGIDIKGQAVKFFVEKNKTAPPKRRGHFWFYFDNIDALRKKGEIDNTEESIRLAMKYGIINQRVADSGKRTGMYDYINNNTGELRTFKGKDAVADFILNDRQASSYITTEVLKRVLGEMVDEEPKEAEVVRLRAVEDDEAERDESSEAI